MMIVFVDTDKVLQEQFDRTFRQTNKVYCFNEMFEAYLWIKKGNKSPDIIVSHVDIHDPSAMQTIKFLESKSKLKDTKLVAFTSEVVEDMQRSWVISEGADAVFERENLLTDISTYIKFITTKKSSPLKSAEKKTTGKK